METRARVGDKQPVILMLGNARPNEYGYFRESGLKMVLLHDRHCPVACPPREDFEEIIPTDFSSDEPLLNYRKLAQRYEVMAQVAAVETAVLDNAKLAVHTLLAAPTVGAATLALNKAEMRKAFVERLGQASTSQSAAIDSEADLQRFLVGQDFPIVLKPTNLFGSMFVIISHSAAELLANYREMVGEIRIHLDEAGRSGEPVEIQAETFLDGTSHSIDCIVDANGEVYPTEFVDVLTERSFGLDKVQHYARFAPSLLSPHDQKHNRVFCQRAVKALGLSCCVAHVEFIQTRQGPRLLEIAARPGGNRVHLMKEVFGIEIMALYLAALTSAQIHVAPKYVRPRAIVSVYPDSAGALAGLRNEMAIVALPGYVKHGVRVGRGETVGPAQEGFLPTLGVEIEADTTALLLGRISMLRALGPLLSVVA